MPRFLRAATCTALAASMGLLLLAGLARALHAEGLSDYGEGTVLTVVRRLDRDAMSPQWLALPEMTLAPYGPGYYYTVHALTQNAAWKNSLVPGRLASLAALLATTLVIGAAAGTATRSPEIGLTAAVLYLACPLAVTWGTTYRVDAMAAGFGVAACAVAGCGRRGLALSAVLVAGGSLVKQTIALSALGVFAWLLLDRRFREAASYALLVGALGIGAWLVIDRASGGFYFSSALAGNLGRMSPGRGLHSALAFLASPIALAALWTAWQRAVAGPTGPAAPEHSGARPRGASRFVVGFATATLVATVTACRDGSASAYFLEASGLATLAFAVHGLGPLVEAAGSVDRRRAMLLAGLAALAVGLAIPGLRFVRERGLTYRPDAYAREQLAQAIVPGERVLADGQHLAGVLAAGAIPVLNDPFYFRQMTEQGRASAEDLARAIERGEVQKLVLRKTIGEHQKDVGVDGQKWPARVLEAMASRFVLEAQGENLAVYRLADELASSR